jgi:hypothetical protein
MNIIVRVEIVSNENVDAILVNETPPRVSSMNITDDVVFAHDMNAFLWGAKITISRLMRCTLSVLLMMKKHRG